jgi:hypothetical protein
MNKKQYLELAGILFTLSLTACQGKTSQVVKETDFTPQIAEVTRLVPQTVEITRIVPKTVLATQIVADMTNSTLEIPNISATHRTSINPDYFDGVIVITQYYTFLGNGLYEQAYQLLSASVHEVRSLDDYIEMASHVFKAVEIDSILPYNIAVEQQGGHVTPDPSNKERFAVQIRSWGEGNTSGSQPNGVVQDLFLGLVLEDGKWKIETFATAPLP